ncbi:MAG: nickel pincer cofactor biosynthesis protein LarC [Beduini sp.]|uniref:nickel pincer cofactor biosynthesis protein LarC n=1 Tax=Beduini sp. TaxID=1922300 RepID=UPI0011CC9E66
MKALYFDCTSGISGNMTLGALVEILGDHTYLLNELKKLHVDGYHIHISKSVKNGITGTYVDVHLENIDHHHHHEGHSHEHSHDHEEHDHSHQHVHRNLFDVNKIIDDSEIAPSAKALAKRIFLRVAKAESKVHNETLENVHFHEVGAIDSIVDIIGTAVLIDKISPDIIYSSVVNDGYGFIECAHGTIPVPVPATSEIFAASNVIARQIDIDTELVTPTGAAIIAELASSYGTMPAMNVEKIGWGSGTKDLKIPNVLKVVYGEIKKEDDDIIVIETNIDDCNGEILAYTLEQLFKNKALDAFFTPIYMKKNRPAYRLTVVCKEEELQAMQDIIFKQTTTIGMRYRREQRAVLERQIKEADTPYGKVRIKEVSHQGNTYLYPEYEDLKRIADDKGIAIKELYTLFK